MKITHITGAVLGLTLAIIFYCISVPFSLVSRFFITIADAFDRASIDIMESIADQE